ncbi:MAG TPA: M1 family metallopeptidase [Caulobacteraceae bacterium]
MTKLALLMAGLALVATACSNPEPKASAPAPAQGPPGEAGASLRLPSTVQPVSYRIDITPDTQRLTFQGSETIRIQVRTPVRTILLNALNLSIAHATLDGRPATKIALDPAHATAQFDFGQTVAPGSHVMAIDYAGKIDDFSAGLFHLDYNSADGKKQRMLVTQFENADARRLAPLWDDPAVKASFQLSVAAPIGQMAVSNTPVAEVQPLAGGLQRTIFQHTPRMSSYLMFLAVGDLQRVSRKVDGVDVGVIVRRGETAKASFALDQASAILRYYDDYFGIRFPLPKLDLIAAPGSGGFGAMENWGAILYFERDLLIDAKYSTEQDRQDVAVVIAHEMAHQWFGDLVTMSWWNDLWLNEGFATWMEAKAVDHLHPAWRIRLSEASGREGALQLDATSATHPVDRPAETTQQMDELGDAITYDKAAAVLRMLEVYVGEDAWRSGVRAYLKAHAYGNASHDDLWRAVEAAAGKPIAGMAADFTEQDGVPLIAVQLMTGQAKGSGLFLTEERFAADAGSQAPRHWRAPVAARPFEGPEVQTLVHGGPLVAALTSPSPGPLVVNPDEVGYFRTLYAPSAFDPLAAGFARLQPFDQLNMLRDAWALGQAGEAPAANVMILLKRLPPGAYPLVWSDAADMMAEIYYLHAPADRAVIAAFGRRVLAPVLKRIGWTPRPGEPAAAAVAREELILALGDLGDPGVIAEASRRFGAFQASPASLPAGIRKPVLYVVGQHGGAQAFDVLQRLAQASTDFLEQRQYLSALARAADPALAQRALDLALGARLQTSAGMQVIQGVAGAHPDLAWRFAQAHKAEIDARSDPTQKLAFIPRLLRSAADPALADALHVYAQTAFPAGGRAEADKVEARVRQRAGVRAQRLPALDQWLETNG